MCPGQWEARLAVVERSIGPRCGGVATFAGLRHTRLHVIRVGGCLVVLEVARRASSDGQVKVPVHMALRAGS